MENKKQLQQPPSIDSRANSHIETLTASIKLYTPPSTPINTLNIHSHTKWTPNSSPSPEKSETVRPLTPNPLPPHPTTNSHPVISGIVIVNNQPFKIKPRTSILTTSTPSGLPQTCHQIRAEYSSLLRKAAFTPGTKTVAPVYDFDFSEMIAFIQTLKKHEIAAANRNRNLVVQVFLFELGGTAAKNLVEWVKVCEAVGIEVAYAVQYCKVEGAGLKSMEGVVGGCREGKKIVKALREWCARKGC